MNHELKEEITKENENDALKNLQVINTAKAIGRGFSPEIAYQLIEMEYYFEIIDIRDYVGRSKKRLGTIRGRLIGRGLGRRPDLGKDSGEPGGGLGSCWY